MADNQSTTVETTNQNANIEQSSNANPMSNIQLNDPTNPSSPYYIGGNDISSTILVTHVLDNTNYYAWARSIKRELRIKNKLGFIDGSLYELGDSTNILIEHWLQCNDIVIAWLQNTMSIDIKPRTLYADTLRELWLDLEHQLGQQNAQRIYEVKQSIATLMQEEDTDVDVAIVKATNHVERPPKERELRKFFAATSAIRPRADVAYCIHALARRLAKTRNWTVALKTLIVIHRTLREGDPTFREELLNFQQRGSILQMSHFKDDSSPIAWDCSAWVRTYALFLEERLECFRILKYDIEAECLPRTAQAQEKGYSKTRDLDSEELLEQLPAFQQLLYRLIGCRAEGAAVGNYPIQYALALVLKESFKIYCCVNDGIINLVDKFFEMPRHEAIKAQDIYKRAGQQAISLSDFYEVCRGLDLARNFQFPVLREPPQSFLVTMEEYIREAPRMVSVPSETLEYPERLMLTYKQEDASSPLEDIKVSSDEPKPNVMAASPPPPNNLDTEDLLGLNVTKPDPSAIEESNVLALAIVTSGTTPFDCDASQAKDFDPNGWELALVSTAATDLSSSQERQLAGGLDSLSLSSLYDEAAYRASQQPACGTPAPNPFEVADPFAMSNNITPVVQVATFTQHPTNPFASFQPDFPRPEQQQHPSTVTQQNPFGDTGFEAFPSIPTAHPQTTNPFERTGLLQ